MWTAHPPAEAHSSRQAGAQPSQGQRRRTHNTAAPGWMTCARLALSSGAWQRSLLIGCVSGCGAAGAKPRPLVFRRPSSLPHTHERCLSTPCYAQHQYAMHLPPRAPGTRLWPEAACPRPRPAQRCGTGAAGRKRWGRPPTCPVYRWCVDWSLRCGVRASARPSCVECVCTLPPAAGACARLPRLTPRGVRPQPRCCWRIPLARALLVIAVLWYVCEGGV
jgi:hypothetical protein